MKRSLVTLSCLAASLCASAQTDISSFFLNNNGFDSGITYGAERTGNISGDVINNVEGWTNETEATYTVAGIFAYNPNLTFNSSYKLPAEGYDGSTGGALGLTTGWGMQLVYTQTVTLPKGTYHLTSAYYNAWNATAGKSLLAWLPETGTSVSSRKASFP